MGLISKIEEKLSGSSKSHTEEEKLRQQQALDTSRTKDTTTGTSSSSTGGLAGHGSHGTHPGQTTGTTSTTGIYNPLHTSGNSATHGGSSGITGGTHPLVTGGNTSQGVGQTHAPSSGLTGAGTTAGAPSGSHHTSGLSGQGSHFAGQDHGNTHHTGMGIGSGTQHSGAGVGSNVPHTGIGSNTHGSGITGGTAIGAQDYAPGTHAQGTNPGLAAEKTTASQPYDPYSSKGQNIAADAAAHQGHHSTHNTHNTHHTGTSGVSEGTGFVPGSHPHANNDSAIPTAGGQKVGGVGEGVGHSHSGVHQTTGDKIKNVLPGQHNAHDAYGNPIKESTNASHSSSSHPGSHATGAGIAGTSNSGVGQSHAGSGLTGSHGHSNVTGSHNNYSHPNQPGSGFSSAAQPLGHDSSFTDRHAGPGAATGLAAGAVGGAGLASAGHHNNHSTQQPGSGLTGSHGGMSSTAPGSGFTGAHQDEYTRGQQAAYQQHGGHSQSGPHNTTSGYAGEDNRGMMDKVKDKMSSQRSNQPDDPVTGTNYDQSNREQYQPQGTGLTGSHPQGSGLAGSGNPTGYSSATHHQPGVGGITSGVDNTHIGSHSGMGSNTTSTTAPAISHEGRGAAYEAGFKDAVAALQGKK